MNYVEKNLRNGEEVIVKAKISFLYLVPRILFFAIAIAIAAVLATVVFKEPSPEDIKNFSDLANFENKVKVYANLRTIVWVVLPILGGLPLIQRIIVILTTNLVVTNKRVVGKQGVLKIQTLDVPVEKIDSVSFDAGVFGNILHYYNIKITSTGSQGYVFRAVSNAQEFKDRANDAIEKHAEQARKDQAEQIAIAMHGPSGGAN